MILLLQNRFTNQAGTMFTKFIRTQLMKLRMRLYLVTLKKRREIKAIQCMQYAKIGESSGTADHLNASLTHYWELHDLHEEIDRVNKFLGLPESA